jgi:protein-lysine N-methyltransferase EEF2KMT
MSSLSLLLSSTLLPETETVQQKAYVTYSFGTAPNISSSTAQPAQDRQITLLESRNIISSSGTTGFRTWEAALHLASYLTSGHTSVQVAGKMVLELGAGTGCVSIACAKFLGAARVVATDGDEGVIDVLKANVFLNDLPRDSVVASVLRWGAGLQSSVLTDGGDERPFDLVLAADVVREGRVCVKIRRWLADMEQCQTFDPRLTSALIYTLGELFDGNADLEVILSATVRNKSTLEGFLESCGKF